MVEDPLVGTVPNLLGIFFVAVLYALQFFWKRRSKGDERELNVLQTQNLIWSDRIVQAMRRFLEEDAPDLHLDPEAPGDLRERRYISAEDERRLRAHLDGLQGPMNDMGVLSQLDDRIQSWTVASCWVSLAASLWVLGLIVLSYLWPGNASLKVVLAVPLLGAVVFCAYKVLRLEDKFDRVRSRYKIYRASP